VTLPNEWGVSYPVVAPTAPPTPTPPPTTLTALPTSTSTPTLTPMPTATATPAPTPMVNWDAWLNRGGYVRPLVLDGEHTYKTQGNVIAPYPSAVPYPTATPTAKAVPTATPSARPAPTAAKVAATPTATRSNPIAPSSEGVGSGPAALAMCFDLSVGSHGIYPGSGGGLTTVTAQQAVDVCKAAYSKENWNLTPSPHLPRSGIELLAWYVNNYRGANHSDFLDFDATQPLTKELTKSILIEQARQAYYRQELEPDKRYEFRFGPAEFMQSGMFDTQVSGTNIPLTSFLGSFSVQVNTLDTPGGQRIGFRIDNETTLASGSHFPGRNESEGHYKKNVEDVVAKKKDLANLPLYMVMLTEPVVSILQPKSKEDSPRGGGNLYQTYTWTEKRDDSVKNRSVKDWMDDRNSGDWEPRLDIGVWKDFRKFTTDPPGFPHE